MRPVAWLFAGFFLVFSLTSSGGLEVSDAYVRMETAKSWLDGQGGALDPSLAWNGTAVNHQGQAYAIYGPLQSVLMVPTVLAARAVSRSPDIRDNLAKFVFGAAVQPAISALALMLLYFALLRLGFTARSARTTVLVIAFATIFWPYARSGQEENLLALGFALWLWGMARIHQRITTGWIPIAGAAALMFAAKWSTVPVLVVMGGYSAWLSWRHGVWPKGRVLAIATGLLAISVGGCLAYNAYRFGSPFETGYSLLLEHLGTPFFSASGFLEGLPALLFSPHRGFFVFSPILLTCFLPGAMLGRSPARADAPPQWVMTAGFVAFTANLVFFSFYVYWHGGFSWGPRFLASSVILLGPALAVRLQVLPWAKWLVAISVVVQVNSVLVMPYFEHFLIEARDIPCDGWRRSWSCECTPVCLRLPAVVSAIGSTVSGNAGVVASDPTGLAPPEVLETTDFRTVYWWPFRFAFRFGVFDRGVAGLVMLAYVLAAWVAFRRSVPRDKG